MADQPLFDTIEAATVTATPPTETQSAETPATTPVITENTETVNTETPATTETTPASTETPAETVTSTTAETPATTEKPFELTTELRLKAFNEELGTNYTTIEEARKIKEQLAEIPTYKAKLEEAVKRPKFANPRIEELNNFAAATNIDDAGVYTSLKRFQNTTEKDPIEALVLAEIISNPVLIEDKELLRESIKSKYNLTVDEDADPISEAKRIELVKFNIKRESLAANKLIEDTMGKVASYKEALPPDTTVENQQQVEANQKLWKETLSDNKFRDLFKTVSVEVPLGKDATGKDLGSEIVTHELDSEQHATILKNVEAFISNNPAYTQENVDSLINIQTMFATSANFPKMMAKYGADLVAKKQLEWELKVANPSSPKVNTPAPVIKQEQTEAEKIEQRMINA